MATPEMRLALAAVPRKLSDLKLSFERLKSFSSALLSFNLNWQDLEAHFQSLQQSIDQKLHQLNTHQAQQPGPSDPPAQTQTLAGPRPELLAPAMAMDAAALRAYAVAHRGDAAALRGELAAALAAAPDPARLVLDCLENFSSESQIVKRTCLTFLEIFRGLRKGVEVGEEVRVRVLGVGAAWRERVLREGDGGENGVEALALLELVAGFGVVGGFERDDVLEVFLMVSRRKQAVELCRELGLGEHMAELIKKLSSKGRQLDAVKFIHHLNLTEQFPLVPILKEYLKESRRNAHEVREKGNNSKQAKNEATAKELSATRAVIKAIEDYKLQSEYPCEDLNRRITQLEQQKANTKRPAPAAGGSNVKVHRQQQPNKRPRHMTTVAGMNSMPSTPYAVPSHPLPLLAHNQPQLVADQPQYSGLLGPYSPIVSTNHYGLNRNLSPPRSRAHLYSAEALMGSGGYDLPLAYSGYATSSHATSSIYPKGI